MIQIPVPEVTDLGSDASAWIAWDLACLIQDKSNRPRLTDEGYTWEPPIDILIKIGTTQ